MPLETLPLARESRLQTEDLCPLDRFFFEVKRIPSKVSNEKFMVIFLKKWIRDRMNRARDVIMLAAVEIGSQHVLESRGGEVRNHFEIILTEGIFETD